MVKHLLTFLGLVLAQCVFGQSFNRPVPQGFTEYEFEKFSDDYSGYYFFSATKPGGISSLGLMDNEGYLAWATMDAAYMVNLGFDAGRNNFFMTKVTNGQHRHLLLDTAFNVLDTTLIQGYWGDAHEHLLLENGNAIIIGFGDTIMDLSNFLFNGSYGDSNAVIRFNLIQEITPEDSVVFEWRSIDHIHPDEMVDGFPIFSNALDYAHMNAVSVDHDGNLLVSFRHLSSIVKVNRETGNIIWRFGGEQSDFEVVNDTMPFHGQHDIRWNPDRGTYSLFDNSYIPAGGHFSRALEYDLDTADHTATLVWEYYHNPVVVSPGQGSHRISDNGFHMIGWGDNRRPHPTFTMVDDLGNVVSNLFLRDTFISYRAYATELPFEFNRPEIECNMVGDSIFLTAPQSTYYLWSSGQSTRTISVSDTGQYVVYVDRGIGIAASRPFVVSDLSNACAHVAISEIDVKNEHLLIVQVYDTAGRVINTPKAGNLYLLKFKNGSSKMKIWEETDWIVP